MHVLIRFEERINRVFNSSEDVAKWVKSDSEQWRTAGFLGRPEYKHYYYGDCITTWPARTFADLDADVARVYAAAK